MSVVLTVLVLTNVFIAIGKGACTSPVFLIALELTDVFTAIGIGDYELPVAFAVLLLTNVFTATGKGVGAEAISPGSSVTLTGRQITLRHSAAKATGK